MVRLLYECWRPAFARYHQLRLFGLRRDLWTDNHDRAHTGRITRGELPADLIDPAQKNADPMTATCRLNSGRVQASRLLRAETPAYDVQTRSGWSDSGIMARYSHQIPFRDDAARADAALAKLRKRS